MGFPSPASDYAEDRISLDAEFIKHPNSTYFMRMEGDSMINAFIPPGALLVVDRSVTPHNQDIVIVTLENEFFIRFLRKNEYKSLLIAANSKIKPVTITKIMDLVVWGVVIAVIIEPLQLPAHVRPS